MKWLHLASLLSAAVIVCATPVESEGHGIHRRAPPQGIDVAYEDENIDWNAVKASGVVFTYIEATGTGGFENPNYEKQLRGAYDAGLTIGFYHKAEPLPAQESASQQAAFFSGNTASGLPEGRLLPGALFIENNPDRPYGPTCYGLDQDEMVDWIREFSNQYHELRDRYPVIYTTTKWWKLCTGNSDKFGATNALWIGHGGSPNGELPAGWESYTFLQSADKDANPGMPDIFNGDLAGLQRFAKGEA